MHHGRGTIAFLISSFFSWLEEEHMFTQCKIGRTTSLIIECFLSILASSAPRLCKSRSVQYTSVRAPFLLARTFRMNCSETMVAGDPVST